MVVREGVKGKEEFIMEYYENDWDMYWDIVEEMYSNLSEEEIEEELMDMAYKGAEDIIEMIRESVDIIDILKPIYNFKSSE